MRLCIAALPSLTVFAFGLLMGSCHAHNNAFSLRSLRNLCVKTAPTLRKKRRYCLRRVNSHMAFPMLTRTAIQQSACA
jgi:hypothetical protein